MSAPRAPASTCGCWPTPPDGWAVLGNPAIVSTASGLTVYFSGIQCSSGTCPQGMYASTSTDGGATWSALTPVLNADQVCASGINAATLSDGTPFQTWWHTGTTVHRSDSATSPDYDFQGAMGAGCCGYYSNLAADGAGHIHCTREARSSRLCRRQS